MQNEPSTMIILRILFALLMLAFYTGAYIYVPSRLAGLFAIKRRRILYIVFAAGAVSFPMAIILHRWTADLVTGIFYFIAATWLGLFFFLLVVLLGFELINLAVKLPQKTSAVVIITIAVLISAYAMWNACSFEVSRVDIPVPGLAKELRILHISDAHIDDFRGKAYLEKIVAAANRQKPDLVLITGDLVDSNHALNGDTFTPLEKLEAPAFFVPGNHENYVNFDKAIEVIGKNNVRVLRNETVETHGIQLIGLDYMRKDPNAIDIHPTKNKRTIKEVLPTLNISSDKPSILMHHSPVGLKYVNRRGIDVMLSGHTHGGQIFPMMYINRLFFPFQKGLFNYNGTYLYVSQGAGTFGPRMRLGTNNEITLIRLIRLQK
jgi:predicted MPP superfamily phosphohydrolase